MGNVAHRLDRESPRRVRKVEVRDPAVPSYDAVLAQRKWQASTLECAQQATLEHGPRSPPDGLPSSKHSAQQRGSPTRTKAIHSRNEELAVHASIALRRVERAHERVLIDHRREVEERAYRRCRRDAPDYTSIDGVERARPAYRSDCRLRCGRYDYVDRSFFETVELMECGGTAVRCDSAGTTPRDRSDKLLSPRLVAANDAKDSAMNAFDDALVGAVPEHSTAHAEPLGVGNGEYAEIVVGVREQLRERWTVHNFPPANGREAVATVLVGCDSHIWESADSCRFRRSRAAQATRGIPKKPD
jgi:hypothetical protein